MQKIVLIAAALLLGLVFVFAGYASAQDVRREDRQADRREDRQADRQQDRRDEANEVEVTLAVPRNADGTINETALADQIRARFAAGVTEIQFRGITAQEAQRLVDLRSNVLTDLAKLLPNDGIERSVRLRGAVDARVQRNEEGELRARIEDINLGTLSPAQRAELARQLASQAGLDRIRIRGADGVRVEFRADRGIVRNEGGGVDNRGNARDDNARNDRRDDRAQRVDTDDRRGRRGGADRADRPERAARVERPERAERAERAERVERAERAERVERVERPERIERPERSGSNSGRG